jgi:hypothetical protein
VTAGIIFDPGSLIAVDRADCRVVVLLARAVEASGQVPARALAALDAVVV